MAQLCILAVAVVFVFAQSSEAGYSNGATGYSCPSLFNYYADNYDCTRFYRCFWGQAYAFRCPAGTRWNQYNLACDHAYNVPCYGGYSSYGSYGYGNNGYGNNGYGNGGYGAHSSHSSHYYSDGYGSQGYGSHGNHASYNSGYGYSNGGIFLQPARRSTSRRLL